MHAILTEVRAVVATTAPRWQQLATLPNSLLTRQPRAGEWSAAECLQHLVDTERGVFPVRIAAFLAGQDFPAFDPDAQGTVASGADPQALATEFSELRAASLLLLGQLTEADLARTARHAELGRVTLAEMLHEWAGHDLMHTVQAERALMQPFIEGVGPWRHYFTAHDITLSHE